MMVKSVGIWQRAIVAGALCTAVGLAGIVGTAQAATMPDVNGLSLSDAHSALKAAGLDYTWIEADGSEAMPFVPSNWTVAGAAYDAGTDVADGTEVTLVVQKNSRSYDAAKTEEVIAQAKAGAAAIDKAADTRQSETQTTATASQTVFSIESYLDTLTIEQLTELVENIQQRIANLQAAAEQSSQQTSDQQTAATPTMGQSNALKSAQNYLSFISFSHDGLVQQLEFEGFSTDDATWAVDNCGADWNEQAAKKAQSYLDVTSFSRDGLIEQLEFEGFTAEQAEYGVTAIGY